MPNLQGEFNAHFIEANRLADLAMGLAGGDPLDREAGAIYAAVAQTHATLALAAATAGR